jgi:CubicO group peptidase (beta-lactamase class C family)
MFSAMLGVVTDAQQPNATFKEALESIRKEHALPGLIAGEFHLDGRLELEAVGFRRADRNDALQIDDPMHLGSCTKSMTATLIGILVDEGQLQFESRLDEIFPEDPLVTESEWKDTTVDQLLRHTSGAPANPPWDQFTDGSQDVVQLRQGILHWMVQQRRKPEAVGKFEYSNLGYCVLGHILEKRRGTAWETEIRERLFEPLGMTSAGFGPPSQSRAETTPVGHVSALGWKVVLDTDNPPALGPAGTVHASMEDWAKYLRVHLMDDPSTAGVLPIRAATLARLQTPREGESYAAGWVCGDRDWAGGRILMHNGSNTVWYCVVFLAPEQKRGVFAASNLGLPAALPCDLALQEVIKRFSSAP